jgi:hypothetical protein
LEAGQPLRRPPEIAMLGHRDEVAQVTQVHGLQRGTMPTRAPFAPGTHRWSVTAT